MKNLGLLICMFFSVLFISCGENREINNNRGDEILENDHEMGTADSMPTKYPEGEDTINVVRPTEGGNMPVVNPDSIVTGK